MSAFPKYSKQVCNTYTPDFTAGVTNCTLNSTDETRSRLEAAGTLFRSIEVGTENNNIILECIVTTAAGDEEDVVFKITDPDGVIITLPTFTQEYDSVTPACVQNGFNALRSAISGNAAASALIEIPALDVQTTGTGVGGAWDRSLDEAECLLTSFGPTSMAGAGSAPAPTAETVRTGPTYSLYYVNESEEGQADGSMVAIQKIIEYDGSNWVDHPTPLYPAGSGSPALCGI